MKIPGLSSPKSLTHSPTVTWLKSQKAHTRYWLNLQKTIRALKNPVGVPKQVLHLHLSLPKNHKPHSFRNLFTTSSTWAKISNVNLNLWQKTVDALFTDNAATKYQLNYCWVRCDQLHLNARRLSWFDVQTNTNSPPRVNLSHFSPTLPTFTKSSAHSHFNHFLISILIPLSILSLFLKPSKTSATAIP